MSTYMGVAGRKRGFLEEARGGGVSAIQCRSALWWLV